MKLKKWLKAGLCLVLALVLVAAVVLFWHFPRYVSRKTLVEQVPDAKNSVTIMSANVRCLTPLDLGEKSWFYRADLFVQRIAQEMPGIIGFQEVTGWQYDYLTECLAAFDSVIEYRDESIASEGCPVFYSRDLYTLVDKGSFWLSETPEVMSKDWGAACYRICSYVILTDRQSGKDFVVFNTHLDHVSDEARINGIAVVLDKIQDFGGLPSVIMGDLNALEDSETYRAVTEHFADAYHTAEQVVGNVTYQNWGTEGRRIDYFMLSPDSFEVLRCQVVDPVADGTYISDHSPLLVEFQLK